MRRMNPHQALFALAAVGLGIYGCAYGDFAPGGSSSARCGLAIAVVISTDG